MQKLKCKIRLDFKKSFHSKININRLQTNKNETILGETKPCLIWSTNVVLHELEIDLVLILF